MKQSAQISLLVITIVITIFVFTGMWYLRPGVPNEIIQQAKARQSQPLMEVTPPVKKPTVEEVPQTETLAKELLPQLQEKLEPALKESIASQILSDADFQDSLVAKLKDMVAPAVTTVTEGDAQKYQAEVKAELEAYVEQQIQQLRTDVANTQNSFKTDAESQLSTLQADISKQLEDMKASITSDMQQYVPQVVDSLIPQVVEQVVAQLKTNQEAYLAELKASIPEPGISEEQAIAMYTQYRDAIVQDLVPSMLDSMESSIRDAVDAYLVELNFVPQTPVVSATTVSTQTQEPVAVTTTTTEATTTATTSDTTATATTTKAVVATSTTDTASATASTTDTTATTTATVKSGQEVIAIPTFADIPTVTYLDPEVYEALRQSIRTQAIQEVLDRISAE